MFCGEGMKYIMFGQHELSLYVKAGEQDFEVYKCQHSICGRFFHIACLGRSNLVEVCTKPRYKVDNLIETNVVSEWYTRQNKLYMPAPHVSQMQRAM